jgi:hypothetical protein
MMVDGVMPLNNSGLEGEDEYGEENGMGDETIEMGKIKKEKVFSPIDSQRRKTKIIATIG